MANLAILACQRHAQRSAHVRSKSFPALTWNSRRICPFLSNFTCWGSTSIASTSDCTHIYRRVALSESAPALATERVGCMWILCGYIRCGGSTKLRLRKPTCWTYRGGKFSNQNQKWELRLERKHKHSKIIRRKTLPSFSTTNQRKLSLSEKAMISVEALADDSIC